MYLRTSCWNKCFLFYITVAINFCTLDDLEKWLWIYYVSWYDFTRVPSAKVTRVTIWKVAFSSNVWELLWFALFSGNTDCMNFRNLKTRKLFSYKNGFALSSTRLARDSSVSWKIPKRFYNITCTWVYISRVLGMILEKLGSLSNRKAKKVKEVI